MYLAVELPQREEEQQRQKPADLQPVRKSKSVYRLIA